MTSLEYGVEKDQGIQLHHRSSVAIHLSMARYSATSIGNLKSKFSWIIQLYTIHIHDFLRQRF